MSAPTAFFCGFGIGLSSAALLFRFMEMGGLYPEPPNHARLKNAISASLWSLTIAFSVLTIVEVIHAS